MFHNFCVSALWFSLYLFVIESGYLLAVRHRTIKDMKDYLLHIFTRVIFIYLLFVAAIRFIHIGNLVPKELFLDILRGRTSGNYYFIPLLIQLYLIFPIILRYKKIFMSFPAMLISFLFTYISFVADWFLQSPDWNSNFMSLTFFGRFFVFFLIGMKISEFDTEKIGFKQLKYLFLLYILGITAFSIRYKSFQLTFMFPVFVFLFLLCLHNIFVQKKKHSKFSYLMEDMGKHSLVIYLMHVQILYYFVIPMMDRIGMHLPDKYWMIEFVAILLLCLVPSYLFSRVFIPGYMFVLKKVGLVKKK
ncbi:MAG: acyltransferase [Nanoarchaeota archaeon]|nr:acyltransferase [Nanoarchaeota archaeon]